MAERVDSGETLVFGEGTILIKVSTASTGGVFTVFEEVSPLLDTPLHVHANEDELFYILEGEHIVQRGDEQFHLGPGDSIFLPRGVPHSQRRVVPKAGRMLVMTAPGAFEGFFRELAAAEAAGTLGPDAYAAASEKYGITWLG